VREAGHDMLITEIEAAIAGEKLDSKRVLHLLAQHLRTDHGYNMLDNELVIPIGVLIGKASPLESITRYLVEEKGLRYSKIARLLNRNIRTIWTSYHNSLKKQPYWKPKKSKHSIPVSIFSDRRFSVLESIVVYLKDSLGLKLNEIPAIINKSPSTVYTVYKRSQSKIMQK
jgi:hypothetical protein